MVSEVGVKEMNAICLDALGVVIWVSKEAESLSGIGVLNESFLISGWQPKTNKLAKTNNKRVKELIVNCSLIH